jgi:hypothetical protein
MDLSFDDAAYSKFLNEKGTIYKGDAKIAAIKFTLWCLDKNTTRYSISCINN